MMENSCEKKRSLAGYLRIVGVGFTMGTANIIPGVSGGTMAFITGIFEELINSIKTIASAETLRMLIRFDLRGLAGWLPWKFLLALVIGMVISFATMTKLFVWLLEEHQAVTYAFFLGLIAASIISVNRGIGKWSIPAVISLLAATGVAYAVISLVPVSTPDDWWMIFLCGAICIIAMILPGLSGSFLLLVLGQYNHIWGAISDLTRLNIQLAGLISLFWFGIGCVVGLGSFVHLLNYLMRRFRDATMAALVGFMVGSLPRLWPWQHVTEYVENKGELVPVAIAYDAPVFDLSFLWIALAAIAGLVIVLIIEYIAAKEEKRQA